MSIQRTESNLTFSEKMFYHDLHQCMPWNQNGEGFESAVMEVGNNKGNAADSTQLKFYKWLNDPASAPLQWQSRSGEQISLSAVAAKKCRQQHSAMWKAAAVFALALLIGLVVAICATPLLPLWAVVCVVVCPTLVAAVPMHIFMYRFTKNISLESNEPRTTESERARLLSSRA